MQHDYRYVTRREANVVKNELMQILNRVQNIVRPKFTFKYWFIGSSLRNMITYDANGNQGYDFDINVEPHYDDRKYNPGEIKRTLRLAFDQVVGYFGYSPCEDSTRVLTFKFKDTENSRVLHSCDVAIVNDYEDEEGNPRQEYIHFNKQQRSYYWAAQPRGYYGLEEKYQWIKKTDVSVPWKSVIFIRKILTQIRISAHAHCLWRQLTKSVYRMDTEDDN